MVDLRGCLLSSTRWGLGLCCLGPLFGNRSHVSWPVCVCIYSVVSNINSRGEVVATTEHDEAIVYADLGGYMLWAARQLLIALYRSRNAEKYSCINPSDTTTSIWCIRWCGCQIQHKLKLWINIVCVGNAVCTGQYLKVSKQPLRELKYKTLYAANFS
jgi:hypothetical protein